MWAGQITGEAAGDLLRYGALLPICFYIGVIIIALRLPKNCRQVTYLTVAGTFLMWASSWVRQLCLVLSEPIATIQPEVREHVAFALAGISGWCLIVLAAFVNRPPLPAVSIESRYKFRLVHLLLTATFSAIVFGYLAYLDPVDLYYRFTGQLRYLAAVSHFLILWIAAAVMAHRRHSQSPRAYSCLLAGCTLKVAGIFAVAMSRDFYHYYQWLRSLGALGTLAQVIAPILIVASVFIDRFADARTYNHKTSHTGSSPMSLNSALSIGKPWIAAAIVLIGTALPWMHSEVRATSSVPHRFATITRHHRVDVMCTAWTTTFRINSVAFPLGIVMAGGAVAGAWFAKYRGTTDSRRNLSLTASIASIVLLSVFAVMATVARDASPGIGTFVSLCGFAWQMLTTTSDPRQPTAAPSPLAM